MRLSRNRSNSRMLGRTRSCALASRLVSAVCISTSCRRRASSAASSRVAASGSGRTCGCTAAPKRARTWASSTSVFASCPMERANCRTWRGLTTTTGSPTLPKAATTGTSYAAVASSTIRSGPSCCNCSTSWPMPRASLLTCHCSPLGTTATSSVALLTSIPTTLLGVSCAAITITTTPGACVCLPRPGLADSGSDRSGPGNCSGCTAAGRGDLASLRSWWTTGASVCLARCPRSTTVPERTSLIQGSSPKGVRATRPAAPERTEASAGTPKRRFLKEGELLREPGFLGRGNRARGPFVIAAVADVGLQDVHLVDVIDGDHRQVVGEHLRQLQPQLGIGRGRLQGHREFVQKASRAHERRELAGLLGEVEVVRDVEGRQRPCVLRQEAVAPAAVEAHLRVAAAVGRLELDRNADSRKVGLNRGHRVLIHQRGHDHDLRLEPGRHARFGQQLLGLGGVELVAREIGQVRG